MNPIHILVDRVKSDDDATLSIIYLNGKFQCFGIEDEYREDKVAGETRIPAGVYDVGVRDVGGFHNRYSKKFPSWHEGMLQVLDVPNFEYILIHIGNTDEHTAGCLLVGADGFTRGELRNGNSGYAYEKLYRKVISAAITGCVTIEYKDSDR